ncbi:Mis12-Mtw1 protein family-domain-containing protein [Calycina marina]|uniref:Mis12-Mtw1 protein family-domain-containing protein n=1 Tax=Calycina marina TaxID=1763456 RepID=A0A9P7ZB19_9HELO|nr:Mis12-Mtw1 protein family-domain-containing protein [Calycina marina]
MERRSSTFHAHILTHREAYDEEDGDFVFTRASKRTKTAQAETEPAPVPAPLPKKTRKTKETKSREDEGHATVRNGKERKPSSSSALEAENNDALVVPKRRRSTRTSLGKLQNGEGFGHSGAGNENTNNIAIVDAPLSITEEPNASVLSNGSNQPTMIALPFSDTPVINRNKELRKKGGSTRRSSLGMRGRRASSLIDNGHSAIPHREVNSSDFYKHIEAAGLSEPRRMKQLLTWNGERALGEKPSHGDPDSAAALAARVIKESLLKDFANKSQFSDWFSREESTIPTKIIKKPNPRNEELQDNIADLEARVKKLREERDQWKALAKPQPALPPLFSNKSPDITPSNIDASLLDSEQAVILASLTSLAAQSLRQTAAERLRKIQSTLEFEVDRFADGVHKVEQYQDTVGRVAGKIISLSAVRLDERDKREKEAIGTRDLPMQEVLRSLSRILPKNESSSSR